MEAATGEEKTKTEGGEDGESRGSGAEDGKSKEEEEGVVCEIKHDNSGTVDMPIIHFLRKIMCNFKLILLG